MRPALRSLFLSTACILGVPHEATNEILPGLDRLESRPLFIQYLEFRLLPGYRLCYSVHVLICFSVWGGVPDHHSFRTICGAVSPRFHDMDQGCGHHRLSSPENVSLILHADSGVYHINTPHYATGIHTRLDASEHTKSPGPHKLTPPWDYRRCGHPMLTSLLKVFRWTQVSSTSLGWRHSMFCVWCHSSLERIM